MRVVAFWGALAGLVAAAGQGVALVLTLTGGAGGSLARAAAEVATIGQIAFTVLVAVFLLIVAVTGRKA